MRKPDDGEYERLIQPIEDRMIRTVWRIQQLSVVCDAPVPVSIANYAPPKAKRTDYDSALDPEFERFNLRLRRLAEQYRSRPLPDRMELVPRDGHEELASYYPADLPGIKSHRAVPVDGPLPLRRFTT